MKTLPNTTTTNTGQDPLLRGSSFFKECIAERDAINRHRRKLADCRSAAISFDEALVDWIVKKRTKWLARRRSRLRQAS